MPNLQLDCPHCGTEKVGFYGDPSMACDAFGREYIMLMQCGYCKNGVVVKFEGESFLKWCRDDGSDRKPYIIGIWPKTEQAKAPNYMPENLRIFFLQGIDSLQRKNYDAAGTMFRKTLDVALKRIHPESKGTLYKRIDALPTELGITPAMKQWAHEIRDLGNDAAHEEEPFTEAEAKALHAFSEMFLTYAFTLPGLLEERKKGGPPI